MLSLGHLARLGFRAHVEADDDRVGSAGQQDVALGDPARGGMQHLDFDLVGRKLDEAFLDRFDGTEDVGLDNHVEFLDVAGLDLGEKLFEADLGGRSADLRAQAVDTGFRKLAGVRFGFDGVELLAGVRNAFEAQDLRPRRRE